MKWAVAQGWRPDNPADAVATALPKQDRRQEHRRAMPWAEVPDFLAALRASGAGPATKLAIEFLILTAARSGEVRGATWSEIDLAARVWTIPPARMKAKHEHRVPLGERALAILAEAQALGSDFLFPGTKAGRPLSDMTLPKLVKEIGYPVDVHGFRTSFRTWAQERTNFPRDVVEKALAHSIRDKSEAAYARSDLFERRRKLMEAWAAHVAGTGGRLVALRA
jgi:integrase